MAVERCGAEPTSRDKATYHSKCSDMMLSGVC
jgi:hypothetical protein